MIEDNAAQANILRSYLESENHEVVVAGDGLTALDLVRARKPDLVVLDVMLPGLEGSDVCRLIRADDASVPIIMVTAKSTEDDLLSGLDCGADDYVTKPYSPRELMARIRTHPRRVGPSHPVAPLTQVGELMVDPVRFEARSGDDVIDLTPREFELLAVLASEPGRAFSRSTMLESVAGFDNEALERTVDMHVMNLRCKLETDPSEPRYVLTVKDRGSRLADQ